MMVAVETISEENIRVSGTLPNKQGGCQDLHVDERKDQPGLVEQAVDHPEEGDGDVVEIAVHGAAQLARGTAPSSRKA